MSQIMKPRQNPSLVFVLYPLYQNKRYLFLKKFTFGKQINKSYWDIILHLRTEKTLQVWIKSHKVQKVVIIKHNYWRKKFKLLN